MTNFIAAAQAKSLTAAAQIDILTFKKEACTIYRG